MSAVSYSEYLPVDGAELFTVVCLPERTGKFPTVIARNPYVDAEGEIPTEELCGKKLEAFSDWIDSGYAVVYQHCRGRGKSSGDCIPYINEREDGLALQDWVRAQDFYNREIFLSGGSYTSEVHIVTAPFAEDIKGAILEVKDSERYNAIYRNGMFKMGLHGGWYVKMYKRKSIPDKCFVPDSFRMLPLSDFSKTVFGESAYDLDETLRHPRRDDAFWNSRIGGEEARGALDHANIPILLVTGFYDIFTGGIFGMWNALDESTREKCALLVHPFDHGCKGEIQPVNFEDGTTAVRFPKYRQRWADSVRGLCEPPFKRGRVTYYKVFGEGWCCDDFYDARDTLSFKLGEGRVDYKYSPFAPAPFKGGLSTNFGGNAWQDEPNSRYDIVSLFTPEFEEDTYVKGRMRARLRVASDCEDTCFYLRLSICKEEGYYGLRDDINQISNFDAEYKPGEAIDMSFTFDEHAFVVKKGERIRIDVSSSAWPYYVPHTNRRGLFSEQTSVKIANNTVFLDESSLELPIFREKGAEDEASTRGGAL